MQMHTLSSCEKNAVLLCLYYIYTTGSSEYLVSKAGAIGGL